MNTAQMKRLLRELRYVVKKCCLYTCGTRAILVSFSNLFLYPVCLKISWNHFLECIGKINRNRGCSAVVHTMTFCCRSTCESLTGPYVHCHYVNEAHAAEGRTEPNYSSENPFWLSTHTHSPFFRSSSAQKPLYDKILIYLAFSVTLIHS